jgi:DNA-binding MarR family transcriptional regulator
MNVSEDSDMDEAVVSALRILLRAFLLDETRFPPAEGRARYNTLDFQTLAHVAAHPGQSAASLAAHLSVSPTTAQSAIERLVRRGLLTREPSAWSRRAVALKLTDEGRDLTEAIGRQDRSNVRVMLDALEPERRAAFVADIVRIAHKIASR